MASRADSKLPLAACAVGAATDWKHIPHGDLELLKFLNLAIILMVKIKYTNNHVPLLQN